MIAGYIIQGIATVAQAGSMFGSISSNITSKPITNITKKMVHWFQMILKIIQ